MIAAASRREPVLLVQLLQQWQNVLVTINPYAPALLRISSGAAYITRRRAEIIDLVVTQLLNLCHPYLIRTDYALPDAVLRPKVLLELSKPYAGLLLRLHYYGAPPTLDHIEWARRELGSSAVLLDSAIRDREVTLGAVIAEPELELPLIHVRAGDQPLAIPMSAIEKALPAQQSQDHPEFERSISLAECLGLSVPSSIQRPALLQVKSPHGLQPMQVESLEGHGQAAVMPPGPLFLALPWCFGFIRNEDQAPVMVIDPWPLLRGFIQ